ncbi:MAG: HAD family hydrolase [Candidatus Aenigmatarchaeota archaeon]
MIRAIFSDLDGTILKDSGIPAETFSVIKKIMSKGVEFGVVTGKSVDDLTDLEFPEKINGPCIIENGIIIGKMEEGKIVPDREWMEKMEKELVDLRSTADFIRRDHKIYKKNYSFTVNIKKSPSFLNRIKEGKIPMKNVKARKNGDWLDFFPEMAGKDKAIEFYCKKEGIDLKDVCALGDDENDIEMMEMVGIPCAVKNSPLKLIDTVKKRNGLISTEESYIGGQEILKKVLKEYLEI